MVPISLFLLSSSESEEETPAKIRKKIRDSSNPLEMPDTGFINLFRLTKGAFVNVLDDIKGEFKPRSRSSSIPPILKLAATLRFLASGSYQRSVGQDYSIGMTQSKVSYVLSETLQIMEEKICPKHIRMPTENEKNECRRYFYDKHGFPGTIGCVDGTHVNIIRPSQSEHIFYNRKGRHSVNVMIVCDHNMKIICVDSRYGGASHDSFVWSQSTVRRILADNYENGERNTWLLGDSGYPLEPWLITPFRSPSDGSRESAFNTKHSKARNIVERTIGILKSRFRCLLGARELHYTPNKSSQIINVCCALHNICRDFRIPFQNTEDGEQANVDNLDEDFVDDPNDRAVSIRNQLLNSVL